MKKLNLLIGLVSLSSGLAFAGNEASIYDSCKDPSDKRSQSQVELCQYDERQQQTQDQDIVIRDHQQDIDVDQAYEPIRDQNQQSYDDDFLSAYSTTRWVDYGQFKAYKLFERDVKIKLNGQYLNEISLIASHSPIMISSAEAYLMNGEVVNLIPYTGQYIAEGFQMQAKISRRPLLVDKIVLRIKASDFKVVNHGRLGVSLGLAR